MKKRKRRLYLVGQDPADIFDDLDKLKSDLTTPRQRRARATETFARIPHDRALALHKHRLSSCGVGGADRTRSADPQAARPKPGAVCQHQAARDRASSIASGLEHCASWTAAGVVRIAHRGPGLAPLVTHSLVPDP